MSSGMYDFAREKLLDPGEVRKRLERMSDDQLRRWGRAARYMCSPEATLGRPPDEDYVLQLEEAIAERKRRHPSDASQTAPGGLPPVSTGDC